MRGESQTDVLDPTGSLKCLIYLGLRQRQFGAKIFLDSCVARN